MPEVEASRQGPGEWAKIDNGVLRRLMEVRYPVYQLADLVVQSRDVSKEEMAAVVVDALHDHLVAQAAGNGA